MDKKKLGVVLFQLGGPDSPGAVEPFLYNLFCDPDIINFPGAFLARKPLARYISHKRAKFVGLNYAAIGGQSPIRLLTERQAARIEQALAPDFDARCFVAMRYWHPLTSEAAAAVRAAKLDALVLFPLYPHYSFATTLSSLKEWQRVYRPANGAGAPPTAMVDEFHTHPMYIEALTERINTSLRHFKGPGDVYFVFSAHGLPLSLIEKGDPYQRQIEETVQAVLKRGGWSNAHTLCYQSRVGRQKWLEPSLDQTLPRLAKEGKKHLLVIPISFVTEHIETLHEINIEARHRAMAWSVEQFEMMPALGDSPKFIAGIAEMIRKAAETALSGNASLTPSRKS